MMKKFLTVILVTMALLGLAACENPKSSKEAGKNAAAEQEAVSAGFSRLTKSQPVPTFDYSQVRQTLIDVETAMATGTVSTTAFYLEGVGLVEWCPSIGAPVASTHQLSADSSWVDIPGDQTKSRFEVQQGEPTGVYVGDSSGTWTLCTDDNGKPFAKYWEGYVNSTIGVVTTYPPDKRVEISQATFDFTSQKK